MRLTSTDSFSTYSSVQHILIARGHCNINMYGDYKKGAIARFFGGK